MKRIAFLLAALFLSSISLAACGASTLGPTTWIDRPLNGTHVPLGSLTILAHASDANDVVTIEFYAFDSLLGAVPTSDGRFGEASLDWMPPGPGTYVLIARAIDSQGNFGPQANVEIVVGTGELATESPTPAPASLECAVEQLKAPMLLSPKDDTTVQPEPVLAWSYPSGACHPHNYKIDISGNASFSDVGWGFGTLDYNETSRQWPLPSGKCYYWRVQPYVPDVNGPASTTWSFCVAEAAGPSFTLAQNANCRIGPGTAYEVADTLLQGQTVFIDGRNQDNSWLWVRRPSGNEHCWVSLVTGQVSGDLNTVQIVNPPAPPTAPAAESTPPNIVDFGVDPNAIEREGCGEPSTSVVSAEVSDAGGANRVIVRILGYGEVEMDPVGGDVYQAVLGPFSDDGELSILIFAWDNAGNASQAGPLTLMVACLG